MTVEVLQIESINTQPYAATGLLCATDARTHKIKRALGSGVVIYGAESNFLTAKHVIDGQLQSDEYISLIVESSPVVFKIIDLHLSDTTDLASGKLWSPVDARVYGFEVGDNYDRLNPFSNIEFSWVNFTHKHQSVTTRTHKGNVVANYTFETPGDIMGTEVIEMSFACLKGASGSPVFNDIDRKLYGIMVQNVDHDLAPTQLIRTVNDDGSLVEEIRYILPAGIAITTPGIRHELNLRDE
jgi:hypothetical protein